MKKRVLLVDDEPGIRATLKAVLEPIYEVSCASDARTGVDLFRQDAPNLVILDVMLPGTDGIASG